MQTGTTLTSLAETEQLAINVCLLKESTSSSALTHCLCSLAVMCLNHCTDHHTDTGADQAREDWLGR